MLVSTGLTTGELLLLPLLMLPLPARRGGRHLVEASQEGVVEVELIRVGVVEEVGEGGREGVSVEICKPA